MATHLRVERVDDPSGASRVWHFDELGEDAQGYLSAATRNRTPPIDTDRVAAEFDDIEVVKFTEYYRVERA